MISAVVGIWQRARYALPVVALLVGVLVGTAPQASAQNTDNFTITKYDVKLELGRDDENRSTLKTTETITAYFPPNQNRGITREFVKEYNNHPTSFALQSVKDENGNSLKYNWNDDQLRVGDADVYVAGKKTYVITYTQRDVTRYYKDTGKDEFYWDVIGTDWRVPISEASVTLHLDPSIASAVETQLHCYWGRAEVSNSCNTSAATLEKPPKNFMVGASSLQRGEGVTVSLGFAPETFAAYKEPWWMPLLMTYLAVQAVVSAVAVVAGIIMGIVITRRIGRKKEMGTIAPEYLPPSFASVTTAATISTKHSSLIRGSVMTAQLLDLAVRHYIKLYEVTPKSFWKSAEYEVEVIKDISELRAEERELLSDMFGIAPTVGSRLNLKTLRNSMEFYKRTTDNDKKLKRLMDEEYGLYEKNEQFSKRVRGWSKWWLGAGVALLAPVVLIVAGGIFFASKSRVLSDAGLKLNRYLEGLRMYIKVAEQDRIAMLQSPEGAVKVSEAGGAAGDAQLVKLYEKVLPYAVLFGQEKEWSKQIGQYYEQIGSQPDWYAGTGAFSAASFASGMSGLNTATSTVSSSSSSTGGSSGGGSAGGGGGGGGGGGW